MIDSRSQSAPPPRPRRRSLLLTAAFVLATAYAVVLAALYFGQRSLLYIPDANRPRLAAAGVPGLGEVDLVTADGLRLLAWHLPPRPGRPVVLYFHGNGGNLDNRTGRVRGFAARGWGLLMPEYRGYGGNPGSPGEEAFAGDARAALAFLQAQGIPLDRIVLFGESLGTGVAVRLAAEQPVGQPVAALVLEHPYASIAALAWRQFPFVPVGLLLRDPFDSLSRIAQVGAPVLMLHGGRDRIVPPEAGQTLFAAAQEPKATWTAPDAGHEDLLAYGGWDVLAAFVARYVRGG